MPTKPQQRILDLAAEYQERGLDGFMARTGPQQVACRNLAKAGLMHYVGDGFDEDNGDNWKEYPVYAVTAPRAPQTVCSTPRFKVGDPRPEGYMAFFEWAAVQQRGGLRQTWCSHGWKFPQEVACTQPRLTASHFREAVRAVKAQYPVRSRQ